MANDDYITLHLKNLPPDPNTPEAIAAIAGVEAVRDHADQEMQAALGADGYSQFKRYQIELPMRRIADEIINAATAAGSPVDPTQAENLTRIMIASATTPQGQIKAGALDWNTAWSQAQPLLDPVQLSALKSVCDNSQLWKQIRRIQVQNSVAK